MLHNVRACNVLVTILWSLLSSTLFSFVGSFLVVGKVFDRYNTKKCDGESARKYPWRAWRSYYFVFVFLRWRLRIYD